MSNIIINGVLNNCSSKEGFKSGFILYSVYLRLHAAKLTKICFYSTRKSRYNLISTGSVDACVFMCSGNSERNFISAFLLQMAWKEYTDVLRVLFNDYYFFTRAALQKLRYVFQPPGRFSFCK